MEALSLQGGAKIRDTWEALKDVLDDFNMVFTDAGMHINSLDVNGVALVNATFWGKTFQRYSCARTFVCGLNMAVLYKTFKLVGKSTELTLRIDERYPSALYVCMENSSTGLQIEVTLKIWGSDKKMLKIENSIFDRYITIPSPDFQSLIGYISAFQNSADDDNKILDIEVHPNALVLASRGQFGVTRVRVKETNTGMSVTEGTIDALDDDVVAVDTETLADEEKDLEAALGAATEQTLDTLGTGLKRKRPGEVGDTGIGGAETETATVNPPANKNARVLKRPDSAGVDTTAAAALADPRQMALSALTPGVVSTDATMQKRDAPGEAVVKNSYNLKYIRYFTKATPLSPMTRLFLRPNYPIIVMYNIGTLGVLRYCLGPAAAEDDGDEDDSEETDDDDDDGGVALPPIPHPTVGAGAIVAGDDDDDDDDGEPVDAGSLIDVGRMPQTVEGE